MKLLLLKEKKKKKKKKKQTHTHTLPHVKITHYYPEISMFKKKNSLKKHFKIFVIQIIYCYHKSPSIHANVYHLPFRVCLFGGEIGWMKNFKEKMGRKTFLECVWLGGEEGK